jgi:predicted PurR-regulated permease PerM
MSTSLFVRNVLAAACVGALLYVGWLLRDVVLLAVLAVFVAVALSSPVRALETRLRVPRALAILLVYLALLALLAAIGLLVLPPFVREFEQFLGAIPGYVRELEDSEVIARWDREYGIVTTLEHQANRLPSLVGGALSELETVTVGAVERLVELVAVLAVAFLVLLDAPRMLDFAYRQLGAHEQEGRRIGREAASAVGGYVVGVFAVSLLAALAAFLMMTLLGIPFAVPLAAQMALFAIVPLVGSTVGATVIAFVAVISGGLGTLLAWAAFWVVYQQTETHVINPFVYRRAVDLRPVLVILAVLAGASLLGVLGALLAIPAAATIQLLVREWWRLRHGGGAPAPPDAEPDAT